MPSLNVLTIVILYLQDLQQLEADAQQDFFDVVQHLEHLVLHAFVQQSVLQQQAQEACLLSACVDVIANNDIIAMIIVFILIFWQLSIFKPKII